MSFTMNWIVTRLGKNTTRRPSSCGRFYFTPGADFRRSGAKEMRPIVSEGAMNRMSYDVQPRAREEAIRRDHDAAIKRQAVEQYLLNELAEEERAHFEGHY